MLPLFRQSNNGYSQATQPAKNRKRGKNAARREAGDLSTTRSFVSSCSVHLRWAECTRCVESSIYAGAIFSVRGPSLEQHKVLRNSGSGHRAHRRTVDIIQNGNVELRVEMEVGFFSREDHRRSLGLPFLVFPPHVVYLIEQFLVAFPSISHQK